VEQAAAAELERSLGSLVHANSHAAAVFEPAPELQIDAAPPLHPVWQLGLLLEAGPPSAVVGQQ